jgi:hypothetical protein
VAKPVDTASPKPGEAEAVATDAPTPAWQVPPGERNDPSNPVVGTVAGVGAPARTWLVHKDGRRGDEITDRLLRQAQAKETPPTRHRATIIPWAAVDDLILGRLILHGPPEVRTGHTLRQELRLWVDEALLTFGPLPSDSSTQDHMQGLMAKVEKARERWP